MTARKRPGWATRPLDPLGAPVALFGELVDPRPTDRHEGDLGRHEDALEEGQDDDDDDLEERVHLAGRSSLAGSAWLAVAAFARGSRMRAGTPTASLPAGTSRVTTAPAPVRAPAPMSRGATIIVSTPMNAPSPIVVAVLARAVVVGGDGAGADVDALADLGVAEIAHVVLLRARRRGACS